MSSSEILPNSRVNEEGLSDWRIVLDALHTRFATGEFATVLRLVNRNR